MLIFASTGQFHVSRVFPIRLAYWQRKRQNSKPPTGYTIIRLTLLLLVQPYSEKGCNYANFAGILSKAGYPDRWRLGGAISESKYKELQQTM